MDEDYTRSELPIMIPLDNLSEDPMNNYLQYLFSFALSDESNEIYFYIIEKGLLKRQLRIERSIPKDIIAGSFHMRNDGEIVLKHDGGKDSECPWRVIEEMPLEGRKWIKSLEKELKRIYRIEDLRDLDLRSFSREVNVQGRKIYTTLHRIYSTKGRDKGYCIESFEKPQNSLRSPLKTLFINRKLEGYSKSSIEIRYN